MDAISSVDKEELITIDPDILAPIGELQDVNQLDTIQKAYKIVEKICFKRDPVTDRISMVCWCKNVVQEKNAYYVCKNNGSKNAYCAFSMQVTAANYLIKKGLVKEQYIYNPKVQTEAEAAFGMPRCPQETCMGCSLQMSVNRLYPFIFGKIFYTCKCKNYLDRLNYEITHPEVSKYFNVELYESDLLNKRSIISDSKNKRQKINDSEPSPKLIKDF